MAVAIPPFASSGEKRFSGESEPPLLDPPCLAAACSGETGSLANRDAGCEEAREEAGSEVLPICWGSMSGTEFPPRPPLICATAAIIGLSRCEETPPTWRMAATAE